MFKYVKWGDGRSEHSNKRRWNSTAGLWLQGKMRLLGWRQQSCLLRLLEVDLVWSQKPKCAGPSWQTSYDDRRLSWRYKGFWECRHNPSDIGVPLSEGSVLHSNKWTAQVNRYVDQAAGFGTKRYVDANWLPNKHDFGLSTREFKWLKVNGGIALEFGRDNQIVWKWQVEVN